MNTSFYDASVGFFFSLKIITIIITIKDYMCLCLRTTNDLAFVHLQTKAKCSMVPVRCRLNIIINNSPLINVYILIFKIKTTYKRYYFKLYMSFNVKSMKKLLLLLCFEIHNEKGMSFIKIQVLIIIMIK